MTGLDIKQRARHFLQWRYQKNYRRKKHMRPAITIDYAAEVETSMLAVDVVIEARLARHTRRGSPSRGGNMHAARYTADLLL